MILIIDNHYFADLFLFKSLIKSSDIRLEQYESWQKTGFRNRCRIAGANGVMLLSVPLVGGRNQKRLMKEVRIDHSGRWRKEHWRSIESAYRRSPFFEFYETELQELYTLEFEFLQDWNRVCLVWAMEKLGSSAPIGFTERYVESYDNSKYLDIREMRGKRVETGKTTRTYHQVFEDRHGFLPGLSILDLLFCEGPGAVKVLER
jgi:WbqC-like protein family